MTQRAGTGNSNLVVSAIALRMLLSGASSVSPGYLQYTEQDEQFLLRSSYPFCLIS